MSVIFAHKQHQVMIEHRAQFGISLITVHRVFNAFALWKVAFGRDPLNHIIAVKIFMTIT